MSSWRFRTLEGGNTKTPRHTTSETKREGSGVPRRKRRLGREKVKRVSRQVSVLQVSSDGVGNRLTSELGGRFLGTQRTGCGSEGSGCGCSGYT